MVPHKYVEIVIFLYVSLKNKFNAGHGGSYHNPKSWEEEAGG
jgi:hypothetical protein